MYIAKLIKKDNLVNELVVTIEYSNGTDVFQEVMTTNGSFRTSEQLKTMVKNKIDILNSKELISDDLIVGEEIKEPAVILEEKTKDNLLFDTFLISYRKLQKVNELVKQGVITEDNVLVTETKKEVSSIFKSDYLDLI